MQARSLKVGKVFTERQTGFLYTGNFERVSFVFGPLTYVRGVKSHMYRGESSTILVVLPRCMCLIKQPGGGIQLVIPVTLQRAWAVGTTGGRARARAVHCQQSVETIVQSSERDGGTARAHWHKALARAPGSTGREAQAHVIDIGSTGSRGRTVGSACVYPPL